MSSDFVRIKRWFSNLEWGRFYTRFWILDGIRNTTMAIILVGITLIGHTKYKQYDFWNITHYS